ncbi:MAG: ABC transporter permease [Ilumatobacteraceae bacterium]
MSTLAELRDTRELFWNLTLRELRTRYKRSALGWAWSMLNPLATTLVYSFVFVVLFDAAPPTGNPSGLQVFGLFILCAILPWNYMAIGVGTSMGTVIANGSLVKKVAFPREHLVLATVAAQLVTLFIELGVLSVVMVFFGHIVLLQVPGVVVAAALLSMFVVGLSLMLSAGNVFFRDLNHLWNILLQIWFFLTPVVYSPDLVEAKVPGWLFWLYMHTPMAIAVQMFRVLLYDGRYPTIPQYGFMALWGGATLWVGWSIFKRLAPRFPEEL